MRTKAMATIHKHIGYLEIHAKAYRVVYLARMGRVGYIWSLAYILHRIVVPRYILGKLIHQGQR